MIKRGQLEELQLSINFGAEHPCFAPIIAIGVQGVEEFLCCRPYSAGCFHNKAMEVLMVPNLWEDMTLLSCFVGFAAAWATVAELK